MPASGFFSAHTFFDRAGEQKNHPGELQEKRALIGCKKAVFVNTHTWY